MGHDTDLREGQSVWSQIVDFASLIFLSIYFLIVFLRYTYIPHIVSFLLELCQLLWGDDGHFGVRPNEIMSLRVETEVRDVEYGQ
jgi:hypothetical protein